MCKIYTSYGCHALSQYVTRCITESHNVHKFTLDVTYVQKGVQLVTKVCYYLEFSYIYKHLIINKKALCLIAEGCTSGVHITNCLSATYAVLLSFIGRLLSEFAKKGLLCRTLSTILHHAGHHYSFSHKTLEYALLVSQNTIDARWNVLRLSAT